MPSINPAVPHAIETMGKHLETLEAPVLPSGVRAAIRRQALACQNAMNLIYETTDHYNADWLRLERLIKAILKATSNNDLRTKETVQ